MPNYKSKMLTFLSIGEMTGLLLDNTDEDGILFAVATDATNFKIVMWRKSSTATVDNETVYPANGPGRWHVLATGTQSPKEVMTIVGDTLPGTIGLEVDLIAQKKTNGDKILKGRFNGIFEDFSANNIAVYDDSLGSTTPPSGIKIAVVNKSAGDELYVAKNNTWELLDISGGDDTIAFADLPTGTTSNTVAIGNHSHTLDNLSDVVITSPASGHIVAFNGTNWINQSLVTPASNLDGLSDVVITSPVSGHTLSFDGTNWINAVASGGVGDPTVYINHNSLFTNPLPASPAVGKSLYVVNHDQGYSGIYFRQIATYIYDSSEWRCISASMASAHLVDYVDGVVNRFFSIQILMGTGHPGIISLVDMDASYSTEVPAGGVPPVNRISDGLSVYFYNDTLSQFHLFNPKIRGEQFYVNSARYWGDQRYLLEALPGQDGAILWQRTA